MTDTPRQPIDKPLVIYHGNCPDGFAAAWAAWKAIGDVDLHAARYGEDPPSFAVNRDVFIVDFSYPRAVLEKLKERVTKLTVLDHHKTAEADLEGLPYCVFDMKRSGAGLAWDFFHDPLERPWLIDYVEDRDLWRFNLPMSAEVSLRIRLTPHDLLEFNTLSKRAFLSVANEGRGALLHLKHCVKEALPNCYDVPGLFEGHAETVRCVNVNYTVVSDVLHAAIEPGDVRVALGWSQNKEGVINCSLRSAEGFDCSALARLHGGGGHATASGFRTTVESEIARKLLRRGS